MTDLPNSDQNDETTNDELDLREQLVEAFEVSKAETATEIDPNAAETSPKNRDERGRFAQAEGVEKTPPENAETPAPIDPNAAPTGEAETQAPAAIRPPPGWSPASKAAFAALPESVRADVAKREEEVDKGFARLADYKGMEDFADECKAHGHTPADLVNRYRQADHKLNTDFVGGVVEICQIYQVHPMQLAERLAGAFRRTEPVSETPQAASNPDLAAYLAKELGPLQDEIKTIQRERHDKLRETVNSQVAAFFDDPANPYADNVAHLMIPMIQEAQRSKQKVDLSAIYDLVKWQDPATREQLINERFQASQPVQVNTAAKAKAAAKSVSGAPGTGSTPTSAPASSLRDELRRAMAASRI